MVSTTLYSDVAIRGIVEMSNGTSIGVVDTMPSASAKLSGASVLYMGTDGTNYHTNTVYECTGSGSSWTWTAKGKMLDPDISVATQGQIDSLTSAVNGKLGKTEKAASAVAADKATGDGAGNNIANTYATKNELTTGLAGKLSTTDKAKSAETADSATKATQDGSGNIISSTYLTTSSAESTYAKKTEIAAALKYMGSKAKYSDLPSTGNIKGDVWNVVAANGNTPAGTNYAWDGSAWDPLGGTVDLSSYQTKKVGTASRALITNGSGNIAVSDVTSTELGYLDGVTSAIQTQINGVKTTADAAMPKSGGTFTGNVSGQYFTGTWLQTTATSNKGSDTGKIAVIDNSGWIYYRTPDQIRAEMKAPSTLSAKAVSIAASGWSSNTTMSGFKYRASITIEGCTADHMPIVTFDNAQAVSGNYCPVAETYAGGVYIWSKVNTAITVPSVIVVKP